MLTKVVVVEIAFFTKLDPGARVDEAYILDIFWKIVTKL